jgi:hypothetical protein
MRGVLVLTSSIAGHLLRGNSGGTSNRRVMPTRGRWERRPGTYSLCPAHLVLSGLRVSDVYLVFVCVTGFYDVLSHRLRCLDDETRKETDQRRFRALRDVPTTTYLSVVILPWPLAYLLSTYFPLPIHLLPGSKYSYILLPFCTCCPYLIEVYNFFWGRRPGICWLCLKQYKAAQHCCRPVFLFSILWCSHSGEHPMIINRVPCGQNCRDTPPKQSLGFIRRKFASKYSPLVSVARWQSPPRPPKPVATSSEVTPMFLPLGVLIDY